MYPSGGSKKGSFFFGFVQLEFTLRGLFFFGVQPPVKVPLPSPPLPDLLQKKNPLQGICTEEHKKSTRKCSKGDEAKRGVIRLSRQD